MFIQEWHIINECVVKCPYWSISGKTVPTQTLTGCPGLFYSVNYSRWLGTKYQTAYFPRWVFWVPYKYVQGQTSWNMMELAPHHRHRLTIPLHTWRGNSESLQHDRQLYSNDSDRSHCSTRVSLELKAAPWLTAFLMTELLKRQRRQTISEPGCRSGRNGTGQ